MGFPISFSAGKEIQTITALQIVGTPSKSANRNPSHTSSYPITKLAVWPHLLTSSCTTPEKFEFKSPVLKDVGLSIFDTKHLSTIPYNQLHPATPFPGGHLISQTLRFHDALSKATIENQVTWPKPKAKRTQRSIGDLRGI